MNPSQPASDRLAGFVESSRQHLRRNYLATSFEGAFYVGAMALVSIESVLAVLVSSQGGPDWVIAWLPTLMLVGFSLPPILTAHHVESMARMKPFTLLMGALQRLPYLLAALALWFWGETLPTVALAFAILAPFLSGFCGGLNVHAFASLITRIIPSERRASAMSLRNLVGAGLGLGAGYIVNTTLEAHPGSDGFARLHFYAFFGLCISFCIIMLIRESTPHDVHERRTEGRTLRQNLREIPGILRQDKAFARLLHSQLYATGMLLIMPYLAIHALRESGRELSFTGILISAQMLGGVIGNLFSAWLGDRYGARLILLMGRGTLLAMLSLLLLAESSAAFLCTFFLSGAASFLNMVGSSVLIMDLAPPKRLPTYKSIISSCILVSMLGFALLSSQLHRFVADPMLARIALAALLISLSIGLLLRVPEPRKALA